MSATPGDGTQALLNAVAEAVAERCAHLLARPVYYHQDTSPLGREGHVKAARRGEFLTWKVGKRILARTEDIHRYIEREAHRYPQASGQANAEPTTEVESSPVSVAERSLASVGLAAEEGTAGMEQTQRVRKRT